MSAAPTDLRTEGRVAPVGFDSAHPELAWRLPPDSPAQAGYEIQVSAGDGFDDPLVWESSRIERTRPFGVTYGGPPLASTTRYWWRVRIWADGQTEPGPWSAPAPFETGVLDPAWWRAQWVTGPAPAGASEYRVLYLRGVVDLPAPVVRGRAHVSALGWYRFLVNGTDLTGPALVPRWTPFDEYVEYQVYDVTDVLRAGANVVALAVGDGRFRGRNGIANRQAIYGDRLAGLAQLSLDLADGTSLVLATDGSWLAGSGRILSSDPKLGERVDLRTPDRDWLTDRTPPDRLGPVEILDQPRALVAEEVGQVREIDRLAAQTVTRAPSGRQIVDFGQNFAGVVRIRLRGPAGDTVSLTHGEVLSGDGELDLDYLRDLGSHGRWSQRDTVILDGTDTWWQPWFTIHGFRYVEVDGLAHDLSPADVEGVALSTDLPETGHFDCSDPRLVRLRENVRWSLRSNFVDTPTDCPTRERSGWTGDIQVFGPSATTFVDARVFLRRYLRNLSAEQLPDGRIPVIVPAETSRFSGGLGRFWTAAAGSVGWGDVSVLLPWTLYQYYGDRRVLERQWPSMTAWVDQLARRARDRRSWRRRVRGIGGSRIERRVLDTGFHWGEWLRPGQRPAAAVLDVYLRSRPVVATAYLEHSARVLSRIADVLDLPEDADRYRLLADEVRAAWRAAFLRRDGRVGLDRQDDYVRALTFGLLEPAERPEAVRRLVALVERAGDHVGTGFLSTPTLLAALVDGGRADVAWRLLMQTTSPSWLYQVGRGATTVWETWEGYTSKGRATASHNHYAFGSIAGFLTERVAGLAPAEPGYQVIEVHPLVDGPLTHASASTQTPYGVAAVAWSRDGEAVSLTVTVPPGATARIRATGLDPVLAQSGEHTLTWTLP